MKISKEAKWTVTIPITGTIAFEVTADSKRKAIEAAWNAYEEGVWNTDDVQWEAVDHVTTGNVFHGMQNSVEAQRSDES